MKKTFDEEINKHTDWGGDESTGNLPVSGGRVQEFVKDTLEGKMGCFYYQESSNKYLCFADEENRDLYLEDPEEYADLLLGAFEAPAPYNAEINVTSGANVSILSGDKGNYIKFTFDIKNRSGVSVGDSIICTYTFNNGGNKKVVKEIYAAGTNVQFLADDYLADGTTSVTIAIQGQTTLAATMVGVTYKVINLELSSTFSFVEPKDTNTTMEIPYTLKGTGVKYVEWLIDGVVKSNNSVTDASISTTKYLALGNIESGVHTLQVRAYITESGVKYYSKTLYYNFVVKGANTVAVLIGTTLPSGVLATEPLALTATQYEKLSFSYGIYDYGYRSNAISFKVGNEVVSQRNAQVNNTKYTFEYTPTTSGDAELNITLLSTTRKVNLSVAASSVNISEALDGRVLKLSARGRSNDDTNKNEWSNGGYTSTFNNVAFNSQSGWVDNALVLANGASVDVNIAPLSALSGTKPENGGRTIEIEFETSNVEDESAVICSCKNASSNAGFEITATKATIVSANGIKLETRFKEGDRIKLAFIINKKSGVEDHGLMFISNNGVLERGINFEDGDTFVCDSTLHIGNAQALVTTKVYNIRVYNRALSEDEEFCNYAVDSDDIISIANKNDIYDEYGNISYEKVAGKLPVLIITCPDMDAFLAIRDKKTAFTGNLEYIHNTDPTKNFTAEATSWKKQGTSSLSYPRPNIKFDFSKGTFYDYNGNVVSGGKYAFKDGSTPVDCFTWKADFMESSMSHNTGVARMWNDIMRDVKVDGNFVCRTGAQSAAKSNNYPYDIRTTVDGFPAVVFYRLSDDSELVCMGQYNFNNDKSTEDVFGFKDLFKADGTKIWDSSNVECWEFLEEDGLCLMDDISTFDEKWSTYFEHRYPDDGNNADTSKLKAFVTWVNSCKNNVTKFKAEKSAHIDEWKMAGYYIYLMRFAAVDQVTKNSMLTTEDGAHWYFINYDNDTINGLDNTGILKYGYNITRQSTDEGGNYAYQGHDSVLFNLLEADTEFMEKVAELDRAMYTTGLSYTNAIAMFDTKQSDSWCERIVNANTRFKYIESYKQGNNYLYALQGTRKSHRHYFLNNRFNMFDAMWISGAYRSKNISFVSAGQDASSFSIEAGRNLQYGVGTNNTIIESGVSLTAGQSHTFTMPTLTRGNIVYVYAATSLRSLDLSNYCQTLYTLNLSGAYGVEDGTRLKKLVLGDGTNTNTNLVTISGLDALTDIEYLDIRNFSSLQTMDESKFPNLHTYLAVGSGITSFTPADGATLTNVSLPVGLNVINLKNTTHTTFNYTPTYSLRSVTMSGVSGLDTKTFTETWYNAINASANPTDRFADATLSLSGINWTGVSVAFMLNLKKFGTLNLQGYVKFASLTYAEYLQIKAAYGENVFQPTGELVFDAPDAVYLLGPTSVVGDTEYDYNAVAFPIAKQDTIKFRMYVDGSAIEIGSDGYSTYHNMKLHATTGQLLAGIYPETVDFGVKAEIDTAASEMISISVAPIIMPTAISVSGSQSITATGEQSYAINISPSNYNVELKTINVTMATQSEYVTLDSEYDFDGFKLNVSQIPPTTEHHRFIVTLTTDHNGNYQTSFELDVVSVSPSSISVDGTAEITALGTYEYPFTIAPSNYNVALASIVASVENGEGYMTIATQDGKAVLSVTKIPPSTINTAVKITATTIYGSVIEASKAFSLVSISPSGCTISGESTINTKGDHAYTFAFTPANANIGIKSVVASLVDAEGVAVSDPNVTLTSSQTGFTINVSKFTTDKVYYAKVTATTDYDVVFNDQKEITFDAIGLESVAISGSTEEIVAVGSRTFTYSLTPSSTNIDIVSKEVSFADTTLNTYASVAMSGDSIVANVTKIPPTTIDTTIVLKVTDENGTETSGSIAFKVVAIAPSEANVSGDGTITTTGDHGYNVSFGPSNANIGVKSWEVSLVDGSGAEVTDADVSVKKNVSDDIDKYGNDNVVVAHINVNESSKNIVLLGSYYYSGSSSRLNNSDVFSKIVVDGNEITIPNSSYSFSFSKGLHVVEYYIKYFSVKIFGVGEHFDGNTISCIEKIDVYNCTNAEYWFYYYNGIIEFKNQVQIGSCIWGDKSDKYGYAKKIILPSNLNTIFCKNTAYAAAPINLTNGNYYTNLLPSSSEIVFKNNGVLNVNGDFGTYFISSARPTTVKYVKGSNIPSLLSGHTQGSITYEEYEQSDITLSVSKFTTDKNYGIKVTATDDYDNTFSGTKSVAIDAIPYTAVSVNGADTLSAVGDSNYTLGFTPETANVEITNVSVMAIPQDAVRFSVYVNGNWAVGSANVVKVGDETANYIGGGKWFVYGEHTNTDNVTCDDVVIGNYDGEIISDGSENVTKQLSFADLSTEQPQIFENTDGSPLMIDYSQMKWSNSGQRRGMYSINFNNINSIKIKDNYTFRLLKNSYTWSITVYKSNSFPRFNIDVVDKNGVTVFKDSFASSGSEYLLNCGYSLQDVTGTRYSNGITTFNGGDVIKLGDLCAVGITGSADYTMKNDIAYEIIYTAERAPYPQD